MAALEHAVRFGEPGQVRDELSCLAPVAGVDVLSLEGLSDAELLVRVTELLQEHRRSSREQRRLEAVDRAHAQVARLARTADVRRHEVLLDPAELLHRDLVRAPGFKFLALHRAQTVVHVRIDILRRARAVLGKKPDLMAYLRADSLRLRWGLGRGGLDLRYQRGLTPDEQRRVLTVAFEAVRRRPAGAWLGDILAECGLVS